MSATLYVLCFTFWLKTGEVIHNKTQARLHNHNITKPVSSFPQCNSLVEKTKRQYSEACRPGNTCEKMEVKCAQMSRSEFFSSSASHRANHTPPHQVRSRKPTHNKPSPNKPHKPSHSRKKRK